MTNKEYHKHISDMAYPIEDWRMDGGTLKANIQLIEGNTAEEVLEKNDFWAIKGFVEDDKGFDWDVDPKFEITFIYDSKHHATYDIGVQELIDGSEYYADFVIHGDDYELIEDVTEEDNVEDTEKSCKCGNGKCKCKNQVMIPSFFADSWFDVAFPKFNDLFADFEKSFEELKKSGSKFVSTTCSIDGDGNGYFKKVDNDGIVEKHFKKVDGEVKEVKCMTTKDGDSKELKAADNETIAASKPALKELLK